MDNKTTQLICSLATWRSLRKQNKTQNDVLKSFAKIFLMNLFYIFLLTLKILHKN